MTATAPSASEVLASMPPLSHWPNRPETFDATQCEVTRWALSQPAVCLMIFGILRERRLITFDGETQKWSGNPNAPVDHAAYVAERRQAGIQSLREAREQKRAERQAARQEEREVKKAARPAPAGKRGRRKLVSDDDMLFQLAELKVPATFTAWFQACAENLAMKRANFSLRIGALVAADKIERHPLGHYVMKHDEDVVAL